MKKNAIPVLIIIGLIIVVLIFIGVSAIIEKYTPSDERMSLSEYYNVEEDSQIAIILNHEQAEVYGTSINDHIYVDYEFVHDYLNSRFYWDANENILLYTSATDIISANAEATSYLVGKSSTDFGNVIVKATAESAWISLEYVETLTGIQVDVYDSPSRVVIVNKTKEVSTIATKNDAPVRHENNIKSPILCDVTKGTVLTVLEEKKNWTKVYTTDGITGYIENKDLDKNTTDTAVIEIKEETFSHILKDKPINLMWHQMFNTSANSKISSILSSAKGLNVISPTWFRISDNNGNLQNLASHDYVDYCHDHNVEVWGCVTNFDIKDIDTTYILTHTSARQNLVNQLVAKALEYNLDGINIDFEELYDSNIGDGYIQFLRELSIKCENNDLILSTDVLIPEEYNAVYAYHEQADFVDYVIIMAYDEHYGQESGAGSVASLDWTEEAIVKMLAKEVPANQVVLGIPFYSRLWELTPKVEEESAEVNYLIGYSDKSMSEAKKWFDNNISEPVWLEDCGQFYGECTGTNGVIYKMWLEDNTSLEKRLQLLTKYELAGAAFWKSSLASNTVWDLIIKYIN